MLLIPALALTTVGDTAQIVCGVGSVYVMDRCPVDPSVCPSHLSTAAAACGSFICKQCYIYSRHGRRKTDSFEIQLAEVRVIRLVCSVKLKD